MAFTMKDGRRQGCGLEGRMLDRAGRLDPITLKRAELAEHLVSGSFRGAKAMCMARAGDRAGAEAELETLQSGHDTSIRIITELAGLGDPIASAALSSASRNDERMMKTIGSMFLEDGFLMEICIGLIEIRGGVVLMQSSAYGVVLDRCDAGGAAYRVGAMLCNTNPTSWKTAEGGLMVDVFQPLMLAMLKADAYNSISSGRYGAEVNIKGARFSAEDLEQLRRSDADPGYIARLLSAGGREGLEFALHALNLRFDYLRAMKHHSQDEPAYVMSLANGVIHDEMVRGCAQLNGLPRHVEHAVAMAYGDTTRALALIGPDVLEDLNRAGADMAAVQSYLANIDSLSTGIASESTITYLATLCCLGEDDVRRRARKTLAEAAGRMPGLTKTIEAASALEQKQFIHEGNLQTVLAAYAARREKEERDSETTPTERAATTDTRLQ